MIAYMLLNVITAHPGTVHNPPRQNKFYQNNKR
jgi:hypothetical protein